MNVSTAMYTPPDKVEKTIQIIEAFADYERSENKNPSSVSYSLYDTFSSTPEIDHYNNYSKTGQLNDIAFTQPPQEVNIEPTVQSCPSCNHGDFKPDIDTSEYRNWQDPRIQEKINVIEDLYGRRAAESVRMNPKDPFQFARQRYFDPTARHFVGHDLDKWERESAFDTEIRMIIANRHGHNLMGSVKLDDPIFQGRGLSRSDPKVPRMELINTDRRAATRVLLMRRTVNNQLNELFEKNGIVIPDNLRLGFHIDWNHRLRVTGTDDEDLIRQIEEVLNKNGNASRLWGHIFTSVRYGHIINTAEPLNGQLSASQESLSWLSGMLREHTGCCLRCDLNLVDGKLLTKNGEDIIDIAANINNKFVAAYLVGELSLLLSKGGPEFMKTITLTIEFENGRLYDFEQRWGFGPGQTGWIDKLPGTMHDESLLK